MLELYVGPIEDVVVVESWMDISRPIRSPTVVRLVDFYMQCEKSGQREA